MGRSVLDDLGQEVTGIAAPVSICMALTVILVRLLNPEGDSDAGAVSLASLYYNEDEGDSTGTKLSGALINALVFVGIIAVTTFVMVLLFKYGCTKFIYAYLGLSGFSIFFLLTGIIVIQVLQKVGAHMDWISFTYILFNFAMVGAVVLFFAPAPLLMKQSYLVVTGVAVAFVFTWIPEWTTWILLVLMAVYDILAVLVPGGPLKMLVELAQERDEDIPALVYEARRSTRRNEHEQQEQEGAYSEPPPPPPQQQQQQECTLVDLGAELQASAAASANGISRRRSHGEDSPGSHFALVASAGNGSDGRCSPGASAAPDTPLISNSTPPSVAPVALEAPLQHGSPRQPVSPQRVGAGTHLNPAEEAAQHTSEASVFGLPEAIKLGLGDFIFYSVLVGRAAMYDMFTVFACYIAIIAGLGCTLIWLAVTHHALPALPISIACATLIYFVSRFVIEPVLLPMSLKLIFF